MITGKLELNLEGYDIKKMHRNTNSSIKTFRKCPKKYDYKYNQDLVPKIHSRPLTLGKLIHSCLEAKDKGEDWLSVIKDFKVNYDKLFDEEKADLGPIPQDAVRIMRNYINTWQEVDKEHQILGLEIEFEIKIKGFPITIGGFIDKIVIENDTLWIVEHKTAKKDPPSENFRFVDTQTAIYSWALELIVRHFSLPYKIGGIIFDYIKTKAPTIPTILKNGTMTKRKLDTDKWTYERELKRYNLDPADYKEYIESLTYKPCQRIRMAKDIKLINNIMKEAFATCQQIVLTNTYVRHLDFTCDMPQCEYRQLCITEVSGLSTDSIKQLQFNTEKTKF